ncbi:MAG: FecR domain-containing protein [Pseudomonadota bacterium]
MSREHRTQTDESAIAREARVWVVRMMDGDLGTAERAELRRWRRTSRAHEAAFLEAQRLRKLMVIAGETFEVGPAPVFTTRRLVIGAVAAGAALHLAGHLGVVPTLEALTADRATARGEQRRFELSEGATVELDGDSAIDIDTGQSPTEVRLRAGAAYFDLAAAGSTGLVVRADGWKIPLIEGAFGLKFGAQDVELACARGTVTLGQPRSLTLSAGDAIRLSDAGAGPIYPVVPDTVAAWRRGSLIFYASTLGDVVADINRHRPGRIMILDDVLAARQVNGVFRLSRIDAALDEIAALLALRVTRIPGGIAILSSV